MGNPEVTRKPQEKDQPEPLVGWIFSSLNLAMKNRFSLVLPVFMMLGLMACSPTVTRNPVPLDRMEQAAIPNIPGARAWGDTVPENIEAMTSEIISQRKASGLSRDIKLIALSGGADNGAFGAGLMKGWTELGTRPEFHVVTGISTGALMAPFVFLGPEYDEALTEVYGGSYTPDAFVRPRPWLSILSEASVIDTSPLAEVIERHANEELIAAVAREHRRGRRLYILSTNLDAQRPVIWDLGAIASSGAPNAPDVFRKALLASASIPVGFPAMMFDVEVDGEIYDEMHVDGGVIVESTTLSAWQAAIAERFRQSGTRDSITYYSVRNGRIDPTPESIEYGLLPIAGRSVSTMIFSLGNLGLIIQQESAEAVGADFFATWIGEDFDAPYGGLFDQEYMRELLQYGYEKMMSGEAWTGDLTWRIDG